MKDPNHSTRIVHTCEQIRDPLPLPTSHEERYHSFLNQLQHSMAVVLPPLLYPRALDRLRVQRTHFSIISLERMVPLLPQVLYQERPPPSQALLQVLNEIHQIFHKELMVWHLQRSSLHV